MPADVFIDTDFFIQHLNATGRRKHALAHRLIREDLQHGQRIEHLVIEDRFRVWEPARSRPSSAQPISWRGCTCWIMAANTW